MKPAVLILALLVAGCATTATPPKPTFAIQLIDYNGQRYVMLPVNPEQVQRGDLIGFWRGSQWHVAEVMSLRGAGVFRVHGGTFDLVTPETYGGKLFSPTPNS